MSDDERMIRVIMDYITDIGEPEANWPEKEFAKVSYSRWAASQILVLALSTPDWSPMRAVEEFKTKVGGFMLKPTYNSDVTEIFRIAYETAIDLSDILYAMMPYN